MILNYFLILITLLLISGLALDAGLLEWRQLHLQNAADAAALEGMYQMARGDSAWASEGQAQSANNGFANGTNNVTVAMVNPPTYGSYAGDNYAVQTTISQGVNNIFMALVNGAKSTIAATATAREIPTCIWIMNPTSSGGGSLSLASAGMYATCGVYVNTLSGNAVCVDAFSTLTSLRTRMVGTSSTLQNCGGSMAPHSRFGSAVKTDPLAYITAPTWSTCGYNNTSYSSGSYTISPGVYCGGISLNGTTLTLNPGLYIIAGGMNVNNSSINGTAGVTLYFTKTSGSSSFTNFSMNSNCSNGCSTLYLKAPTTTLNGGIPGVVTFADRNWITHGSQGVQIQNTQIKSDGEWYLLNTGLYMWSDSWNYYTYDGLVIDNIYQFGTSSRFDTNYANLGGVSPLHYEDGVLVQ